MTRQKVSLKNPRPVILLHVGKLSNLILVFLLSVVLRGGSIKWPSDLLRTEIRLMYESIMEILCTKKSFIVY